MEPQVQDTIRIEFISLDIMGKLEPAFHESIFVPMDLVKLNLESLLRDILEDIKLRSPQQFSCVSRPLQ